MPGGHECPGSVHAQEVCIPPLWTEFLTHTCENITYPLAGGNKGTYSLITEMRSYGIASNDFNVAYFIGLVLL